VRVLYKALAVLVWRRQGSDWVDVVVLSTEPERTHDERRYPEVDCSAEEHERGERSVDDANSHGEHLPVSACRTRTVASPRTQRDSRAYNVGVFDCWTTDDQSVNSPRHEAPDAEV
jgi:hypothetical protein